MLEEISIIIILVLIIIIGYALYEWFQGFPTTDCARFGQSKGLPGCGPKQDKFGGICYDDVWTAAGGTKTAICTVDYGPFQGTYTNCFGTINSISIGDSCSALSDWTRGPNWWKTAVCTCQHGGVVTSDKYCANATLPGVCPPNSDYFEGVCWGESCSNIGRRRSEICTCEAM